MLKPPIQRLIRYWLFAALLAVVAVLRCRTALHKVHEGMNRLRIATMALLGSGKQASQKMFGQRRHNHACFTSRPQEMIRRNECQRQ